jgi:hypothetical protein
MFIGLYTDILALIVPVGRNQGVSHMEIMAATQMEPLLQVTPLGKGFLLKKKMNRCFEKCASASLHEI